MQNPLSSLMHEQWKLSSKWISDQINKLSDEELSKSIAEGKNHGVWILGHLIESEDELSSFIGKAPMLWPELEATFGQGSKRLEVHEYPPIATLREQWRTVIEKNDAMLQTMTDAEWDEPHCRLEMDPSNFFQTKGRWIWNLHQTYHGGQLSVLQGPKEVQPS